MYAPGKRCTIAGCNTPVKLRGLCIRHGEAVQVDSIESRVESAHGFSV
jgi:hypothetical protein